jgi:hypothetical protein
VPHQPKLKSIGSLLQWTNLYIDSWLAVANLYYIDSWLAIANLYYIDSWLAVANLYNIDSWLAVGETGEQFS